MPKPKAVAIATVIQVEAPTSAKPGDKALISADGTINGWVGGGCVQPAVLYATQAVMQSGKPCLMRVAPDGQWQSIAGLTEYASSCLGRGSLLLFIEPLAVQPNLCLFGDSAVAKSLAQQAVHLNFNISWQANDVRHESLSSQVNVQSEIDCQYANFIVIATQGKGDKQAIAAALQTECPHILMVVSARKLEALKERLHQDGYGKPVLARLDGPAGIDINAQQPEEIALSVLAAIIKLRRAAHTISEHAAEPTHKTAVAATTNIEKTSANVDNKGGCCGG